MTSKTILVVVLIALWLPVLAVLSTLGGCESGTSGALRPMAPQVEHTITNTITTIQTAATAAVPPPWSTAVEAGGAAVLALLAAWQGLTHSIATKNKADIATMSAKEKE
jgi:hypothetical protein